MPPPPNLFVRIDDAVRGPFASDQLRTLAEVGAITPESEASAQAAGPWSKLQDLVDCATVFPPRRQYQFKTREFENANPAAAPGVDHRDLIAAANRPPVGPPGAPPPLPPPGANDVLEIVRETTRVQTRYEKPLDLTRPPNRRRRDYLILMTAVNGFFIACLLHYHGAGAAAIFSLSGIVFASASITWVMYGVMSRY